MMIMIMTMMSVHNKTPTATKSHYGYRKSRKHCTNSENIKNTENVFTVFTILS